MELNEFLEKFLPDYEEKFRIKKEDVRLHIRKSSIEHLDNITKSILADENFPELLQNFTDKICEKQRENCGKIAQDSYNRICTVKQNCKYCDGGCPDEGIIVLNAEQPKIDDL